jgi:hypothetical protein
MHDPKSLRAVCVRISPDLWERWSRSKKAVRLRPLLETALDKALSILGY